MSQETYYVVCLGLVALVLIMHPVAKGMGDYLRTLGQAIREDQARFRAAEEAHQEARQCHKPRRSSP